LRLPTAFEPTEYSDSYFEHLDGELVVGTLRFDGSSVIVGLRSMSDGILINKKGAGTVLLQWSNIYRGIPLNDDTVLRVVIRGNSRVESQIDIPWSRTLPVNL